MNPEQQLFLSRALTVVMSFEKPEDRAQCGTALKNWALAQGIRMEDYLHAVVHEAVHYLSIMKTLEEFGGVK